MKHRLKIFIPLLLIAACCLLPLWREGRASFFTAAQKAQPGLSAEGIEPAQAPGPASQEAAPLEADGGNAATSTPPGPEDQPLAEAEAQREDSARPEAVRAHAVRGDTIAGVIESASSGPAHHYVEAARKVFQTTSFRAGQPYVVFTNPETGRVTRFEYEINDRRRLVVEGESSPRARLEDIEYSVLLETAEGVVEDNLFQAVADVGESPQLALKLVKLFGSEINFIRGLRPGDSFRVLVEKRYREGEYKGYGRLLAASITCRGKTYEAFLFPDAEGRERYYTRRGENLHKELLQAPLAVTRLTSTFTQSRRHPILGFSRPHLGVDYAAPTGTPVKAVGDGVVEHKGWAGGYGHQITVRHGHGLESLYAHLSGYARGLAPGKRVRQGEVIGYVGSTGLSTGPHLDFRLRQNGKFVDPAKAINPRSEPVARKDMAAFENSVRSALDYLDGRRNLRDYKPAELAHASVAAEAARAKAAAGKARQARRQAPARKAARSGKRG